MENVPHSLPKRGGFFSDSDVVFTSHKPVYDDVFGAPPKFGLPTLAPRLQDYSEIFGGFHSSSSSASIPLLHLPLDPGSRFDGRGPSFDYTEVFGDAEAGFLPSTASFQDLFGQCGGGGPGGYDSSDDLWSPAQSESLSDELDTVSWHGEEKHCPMHVTDDIHPFEEFGGKVAHTGNAMNCLSNPFHGSFDLHVNDFNSSEKQGNSKPFMTVSDISLRTKPSQLPPPSRPPPALVVKLKDSFGRVVYDSSSILFDMKGDDAASAAASSTNGDENEKVKFETERDSVERMDLFSLNAAGMSSSEDERILCLHGKETTVSAPAAGDVIGSRKSTEDTSESLEHHCLNHITHRFAGPAAWREATEKIEVIEAKINRKALFDMVKGCDPLMQDATQDNYRRHVSTVHEDFDQTENSNKFIWSKEAPEKNSTVRIQQNRWVEENNPPEMSEHRDSVCRQQKEKQNSMSNNQIPRKLGAIDDLSETTEISQELKENLLTKQDETLEGRPEAMANVIEMEAKLNLKVFSKRMDIEERLMDAQATEHNTGKYKENTLRGECQKRIEDVEGEETSERVKRGAETEENEKQYSAASETESGNKLLETSRMKVSGIIMKGGKNDEESADNSYRVSGKEQCSPGVEEGNGSIMEAGKQNVNQLTSKEAVAHAENGKHKLVHERGEIEGKNGDTSQNEYDDSSCRIIQNKAGNEGEDFEVKGPLNLSREACVQAQLTELTEDIEPPVNNENESELKTDLNDHAFVDGDLLKLFDGGCKLDEVIAGKSSVKHDTSQVLGLNQTAISSGKHREFKSGPNCIIYDAEAGVDNTLDEDINKFELHDGNTHIASSSIVDSHYLPKKMTSSSLHENMGALRVVPDKRCSQLKYSLEAQSEASTRDSRCGNIQGTQFIRQKEDIRDTFAQLQVIGKSTIYGSKVEDTPSVLERSENSLYSIKTAKSQSVDIKNKNMKGNLAAKDQKGWERLKKESELENDRMRKLEEEREREREREKDRMAVDKLALEAHERSYAEARERTARAAVERATAEVRFRTMPGTRERLEKSSVEARLRTAEARLRAVDKSSAMRAGSGTHDHAEKYVADRFSASFRSSDTRQNYLSSDLHCRNNVNLKDLWHSYSSELSGAQGESPQRCKARLERYRRTAERAASALAEKNRRDLLAQKEREERNRVAEVLDTEIKRWSSGKEGNLRALLSTLQYILGPDSGWQPVPLTEVITSAAVKRSYRKATLCVHPDKLQQRGATIQQKYICEKVFDLLKELIKFHDYGDKLEYCLFCTVSGSLEQVQFRGALN